MLSSYYGIVFILTRVVQRVESAIICRITHYPADKRNQNILRYLVESDLYNGQCYPSFEQLSPYPQLSSDLVATSIRWTFL